MKVLVSGGTGLVGRAIVEDLLAGGHEITLCGRTAPAADLFPAPVGFRPLDLGGKANPGLFDGIEAFVHAAFDHVLGRYRGGEGSDPEGFVEKNVSGSIRLFEAARDAGVSRAVFLSSRAVYDGLPPGEPLIEEAQVAPTSLYGQVKRDCEAALAALDSARFVTASLRVTGVYTALSPNKWDTLFSDYLEGRPAPSRAGSEVHGRDVGQAVRLMLEEPKERVGREIFNVSDIVTDTHEILSLVQQATGCGNPLPAPADRAAVAAMPTGRIRALGWRPGGEPLFARTVSELAARIRPHKTQ